MKQTIGIYLAGSIKKGHELSQGSFWTEEDMFFLKQLLTGYEIAFLNPAFRADDLSDSKSVFGRDMTQVFSSHFVFVDARDRRGLGVGAEMMWAKLNKIPVLSWAPRNSHYHKDHATLLDMPIENYIHPFVDALSDKIVENLEEGALFIQEMIANPRLYIKGIESIRDAMQHYQDTQLPLDTPMKTLLFSNNELQKRMSREHPQVVYTA